MARKMLGSVDLLGLNAYGDNPGMNPLWGVLIGGGVAGVTSIAVGHSTTGALQSNRELVGLGAGLATAGVMYAMKSTRHAALGAAAGAIFAAGIAWLEKTLLGPVQLPAATAAAASAVAAGAPATGVKGLSFAQVKQLGIANIQNLNGLGMSNIATRQAPHGTIPGVAGLNGVAGLQAVRPGTMPANPHGRPAHPQHRLALRCDGGRRRSLVPQLSGSC